MDNENQTPEIQTEEPKYEELNDKYVRLSAEYENFRKRTSKEKDELFTEAGAYVITKFLPVIDAFEKAIEFSPENDDIKALYKQIIEIIQKLGVCEIPSDGGAFDPNLHEAIAHETDENECENTITQTFQKGYTYREKVLRHSVVKVVN